TRALPDRVVDLLGGLRGDRVPSDPAIRQELGMTFPRTFTPSPASTPLNRSVDLSLGTRALVFGRELGLMAGVTYADDYSFRNDEIERKYRASSFDPDVEIAPNVDYTFDRGTRNVRLGAIANVTMLLSPTDKIGVRGTFTRNTDDEARTYWGRNREDLDGLVRSDRLRFVARELYWGQLSGEHRSFWDSRLEWRATLARAARDEPGLRETIYLNSDVNDSTAPAFLENVGESGRYLWSELRDDDRNLELDWRFPFDVWSGLTAQVKFGGAYRDRQRDFAARRFNWSFYGGTITNIDSTLSDTSIVGFVRAPGQFALTDVVEPGDLYAAFDDRRAGYLMLELPLARGLRTIVGARLEDYRLLLHARGDTLAEVDRTDVLPALNVVMELSPSMNLRLAASQTVDRPEFREVAPFQFTEAASLRQLFGNPALTSATVRSLDLRWDWFRRPGELISISGFYKHLDEPIEQVFITAASTAYSFQNAESATLYGLELDVRQRLDALSWSLQNVIVQGNLSLVHSNVRVIETGNFKPTSLERPLEGQADYALNVGMLYQSTYGGTEVGVFFNRLGDRVTAAGGFGTPDIVEQSRNQLDATFKQRLPGDVRFKLKVSNLLTAPYRFTQAANGIVVTQREYDVGTSVSLGLSYEF
ncbi:MAG: TonB-dependent receptor, partial [Gemmatimonadales bacterium]